MHADEVDTDADLVRHLLSTQHPQWAHLPVERVSSAGTDNAIYRLGDDLAVRLPRIGWAVDLVAKEQEWLPRLAPQLPLRVPLPVAAGEPDEAFPYPWGVVEWLQGEVALLDRLDDPVAGRPRSRRLRGGAQAHRPHRRPDATAGAARSGSATSWCAGASPVSTACSTPVRSPTRGSGRSPRPTTTARRCGSTATCRT